MSLLLMLFVLKLLATSLTLGSGASGGVFSPALFLGAMAGASYGVGLRHVFPSLSVSPPAFAVVGMAGAVGGTTGAAMAAIVMIFEMTLDYSVVVPLTIVVAISYAVRRAFVHDNVYTLKLTLRGDRVPEAMEADIEILRRASDIMKTDLGVVNAGTPLREFAQSVVAGSEHFAFLVTDKSDSVAGIVTKEQLTALERWREEVMVGDVSYTDFVVVKPDTVFFAIIAKMRSAQASLALVSAEEMAPAAKSVKGLITREQIIDLLATGRELFQ